MTPPSPGGDRVLALDLGGTVVKAGLVASTGAVLAQQRTTSGEADGLDAWRRVGLTTLQSLPGCAGPGPRALGLSVPGAVDAERGRLLDLVDRLPQAAGLDLPAAFAEVGLPTFADNDARAALQAERRWGLARGTADVVLLTIGTGLGAAALVNGRWAGADPVLGGSQLGHLTIDLAGPRCVCGNYGCAELTVSGPGLVRLARAAGLPRDATTSAVAVVARDGAGDPRARAAVDQFVAALGAVVVNAIHAYQPELVVLAGGLLGAAGRILPPLRSLVADRAWTLPRGRSRIEASALGTQVGLLGAAAVAFRALEGTP